MGRMKLMTKEIEQAFQKTGSQDGLGPDAVILLKIFNPYGSATWYFTEYDPKERLLFGFASLFGDENDEWGYVSLDELENVQPIPGLYLERDLHFGTKRAGDVETIKKRMGWT